MIAIPHTESWRRPFDDADHLRREKLDAFLRSERSRRRRRARTWFVVVMTGCVSAAAFLAWMVLK